MADPIYANPIVDPQTDINQLSTVYTSDYLTENYNTFFNQMTENERLDYMPGGYEDQIDFDPFQSDYGGLDFKSTLESEGFVNYVKNDPVRAAQSGSGGVTVTVGGNVLSAEELRRRRAGPVEGRVVYKDEVMPFYEGQKEEDEGSVFDYWKSIPNISSFSEGLRGSLYGVSQPEKEEAAVTPVAQAVPEQSRPIFSPGGHPGPSGSFSEGIKSGFMSMSNGHVGLGLTPQAAANAAATAKGISMFGKDGLSSYGIYGGSDGDGDGDGDGTGPTPPGDPAAPDSTASGPCFTAGTELMLEDKTLKKVEDIKVGGKLCGAQGSINEVTVLHKNPLGNRRIVSVNGSRFFCTEDHPFKTSKGWQAVNAEMATSKYPHINVYNKDLQAGDTIENHVDQENTVVGVAA